MATSQTRILRVRNWLKMHCCELQRVMRSFVHKENCFVSTKERESLHSKPKYSIWFLSTALGWIRQYIFQISTSTLDLWHQPGSPKQWIWKPQRAWTLVSKGEVTSRSAVQPQPIYLPQCPAFVSSTATLGGKVCWRTHPIFLSPLTHLIVITPFEKRDKWLMFIKWSI